MVNTVVTSFGFQVVSLFPPTQLWKLGLTKSERREIQIKVRIQKAEVRWRPLPMGRQELLKELSSFICAVNLQVGVMDTPLP